MAEVVPPRSAGTFYKVDSSRATFGELWRDVNSPLIPIVWLTKIFRVALPGTVNDPNVESLEDFERDEADVPADVRERLGPTVERLRTLGFAGAATWHAVTDPWQGSRMHSAAFTGGSGSSAGTVARAVLRTEGTGNPPKSHEYAEFLTPRRGGFVVSTSARATLTAPAGFDVRRTVGATPEALWESHRAALDAAPAADRADPSALRAAPADLLGRHHAAVRDHHLKRGLFRPMNDAERAERASLDGELGRARDAGAAHPEVLAELHKLQHRTSSWRGGIVMLVASLALFLGAGSYQWDWKFVALLAPILLFHELGHYVAMKAFGYQNLRMFFIPLFGAAVSGRHYNVAGWKKAVVALAGPIPGILLAVGLGVAGLYLQWRTTHVVAGETLLDAALLAVILNAFNLLPVLPLDGGRVAHALVFSRHVTLDVAFRVAAALGLGVLAAWSGDAILFALPVILLMGLPTMVRLARATSDLRRAGVRAASPDDQSIPPAVAEPIIARVKAALPAKTGNKAIAQHTLSVFESLNERRPGWLASIGLGAVQVGGLVASLVIGVGLVLAKNPTALLAGFGSMPEPTHALDASPTGVTGDQSDPVGDANPAEMRTVIVSTFADADAARAAVEAVRPLLSAGAGARRFGDSMLASIPEGDADARRAVFDALDAAGGEPVADPSNSGVTLTIRAVTGNESDAAKIAAAAIGYLNVASVAPRLIPPWLPRDARSAEERDRHERARATYLRLMRAGYDSDPGEGNDAAGSDDAAREAADQDRLDKLLRARRRGETAEADRITTEIQAESDARRFAALDSLRDGAADEAERALIDAYLAASRKAALTPFKDRMRASQASGMPFVSDVSEVGTAVAGHLGQYPASGNDDGDAPDEFGRVNGRTTPPVGPARYAAQYGFVVQDGTAVTLRNLRLGDLYAAAPAVAQWMGQHGVTELKYEFTGGFADGADYDLDSDSGD